MVDKLVRKGFILGIILLFIGMSVNPSIAIDTFDKSSIPILNTKTLYVGGSGPTFYNKKTLTNHLFSHPIHNKLLPGYNVVEEISTQSNNFAYSVCETNDNGYIVCGYTRVSGGSGGFLIRTDSQGYEIWNKTYFILLDTIFCSVELTPDGGYIVTGATYDGFNDTEYIFLLKTDEQGNKTWQKTYDDFDDSLGITVKQTNDEGYIICGINYNYYDKSNVFLIKTDNIGTVSWVKTFEYNYDVIWDKVQQTTDDGYIIGGTTGDFLENFWLAFLIKTDEYGNEIWNKTYNVMDYTFGYSVLQSNDESFIIVGYTKQSSFQNEYAMIIKTDDNGVEEWNKTYEESVGLSVQQTADNGFIIGGASLIQDDVYALLLKTDLYGNEIWNKSYSGLEEAYCWDVIETEDEGYVLTGMSITSLNPNVSYSPLLKTDNFGNEEWYRYFDFSTSINPGFVKFYGWDVDNSVYKLFIKIGHYSMSRQSSSPIGYYETKEIEVLPGSYFYLISWYGKEGNCSVKGYVNVSKGEYKEILQNLTFCDDLPNINIVKPKNMIYIKNKSIIPFFFPVIIGNIEIEVNASDFSSGIDYVEIYIDNKLMFNHSTGPFNLQWDKWAFGKHRIKTVVYDKVGYKKSDEISVWKFF